MYVCTYGGKGCFSGESIESFWTALPDKFAAHTVPYCTIFLYSTHAACPHPPLSLSDHFSRNHCQILPTYTFSTKYGLLPRALPLIPVLLLLQKPGKNFRDPGKHARGCKKDIKAFLFPSLFVVELAIPLRWRRMDFIGSPPSSTSRHPRGCGGRKKSNPEGNDAAASK